MARPKRRRVQVGDTIILRNPSVPDHPTMPVMIGGQQTVIPAGLVGQVVEVGWWSAAKLVVDLGGGDPPPDDPGGGGGSMQPGDLLRIRRRVPLFDDDHWASGGTGLGHLPMSTLGDIVFALRVDGPDPGSWVRVIHPDHGIRDIMRGDLEPVQPDGDGGIVFMNGGNHGTRSTPPPGRGALESDGFDRRRPVR